MPGIYGVILKGRVPEGEQEKILGKMRGLLMHQSWYEHHELLFRECGFGSVTVKSQFAPTAISFNGKDYFVLIDGFVYRVGNRNVCDYALSSRNDGLLRDIVDICVNGGSAEGPASIAGNYVVAIYDLNDEELILFNDRMGPRRLYYADLPDRFIFAPEVKAISGLPGFRRDLNWKGISDFFNYGYVLGEDTFFHNVSSLASASTLRFKKKTSRLSVEKYWRPRYHEKKGSLDSFADEACGLLSDSIRAKISSCESVVSPISGGLDSRMILGTVSSVAGNIKIKPITYGQKSSDEYRNARKVCATLGLDDHSLATIQPDVLLDKYTQAVWFSEGMIPMTNGHLLLIPAAAGKDHGCVLNGIYGGPTNYSAEYYGLRHIGVDMSFAEKVSDIERVIALNPAVYTAVARDGPIKNLGSFLSASISLELKKQVDVSEAFCNQRDAFFIENRMRRFICQSSLYRFFWEERLPLSSYELYDFYLAVPPAMKLNRDLLKKMILRKFPDLARIPDANTGQTLLEQPTWWSARRKRLGSQFRYYVTRLSRGFIALADRSTYAHYGIWFRRDRETASYYETKLFSSAIAETGLFDMKELRHLYQRGKKGDVGFEHLVRIATFAVWYELFVLDEGVKELRTQIASSYF